MAAGRDQGDPVGILYPLLDRAADLDQLQRQSAGGAPETLKRESFVIEKVPPKGGIVSGIVSGIGNRPEP